MEKYAVLGNPIDHSLSPVMQNAAFQAADRAADYQAIEVSVEAFDSQINQLLAADFSGFNVTVPFKERILPYLDKLTPFAAHCGAVNTLIRTADGWLGDNTDGAGFMEGLKALKPITKADRILVIGAGGAAKAIYLALAAAEPGELVIANRTVEKAAAMCLDGHEACSLADAAQRLAEFSVIVQTTSLGLPKSHTEMPLQLDNLQAGTIVIDIIYNPAETRFLQAAKARGAIIQNGLPMFIGQGALAYERWTTQVPDKAVMKTAVLEQLGGKEIQ